MASSSAPVRPALNLAIFLILLIVSYVLVFFTGDHKPDPKLGIDLQGGTRVTLTARTPDGSPPTKEALNQAQQIISARVDGLGVSGSEVVVDGDNLVITVPGSDGNEARNLGQTARLYIRPVVFVETVDNILAAAAQFGGAGAGATPGQPAPGATPGQPPVAGAAPTPAAPAEQPAPQPRPYPAEPPSPAPPSPPPPSPAPQPGGQQPSEPQQPTGPPPVPGSKEAQAAEIAYAKEWRQNPGVEQLAQLPPVLQLAVLSKMAEECKSGNDILAGNDDPKLPLLTCSQDRTQVYALAPSIISGEDIGDATSGTNQQTGENIVSVEFKGAARDTWSDFTAANVGTATAFTLDSQVVSAPQIEEPIPGGQTQISGKFTAGEARELANVLKYGSLPLSFESSEAETVSATLGLASLKAGLIAGAVGLALVLVYALLYYRVLGILTALSLVASGAMVYAILILLGRWIGYTLDLAGIAGLIIGIGTTADSFVVFFERIKDEIREGRSFRSAVPRGWARARKTIMSGNAVSFLAAAVLYVLAVGQVKGFAFTLGLTTILDVVVVFLVTWPLVYLASKSARMAKPAFNGLGAVQQIARERRAAAHATGRG